MTKSKQHVQAACEIKISDMPLVSGITQLALLKDMVYLEGSHANSMHITVGFDV